MAGNLTKTASRSAMTQLTATGSSTAVNVTADRTPGEIGIRHANGTGSITVGATVVVQYKAPGGSNYYALATFVFGLTASAVETRTVLLPPGAAAWQLVYTAPTGSTGHTLDADGSEIAGAYT